MKSLKVSEQGAKSLGDFHQLSISSSHGDVNSTYQSEVQKGTHYEKQKPKMHKTMDWS